MQTKNTFPHQLSLQQLSNIKGGGSDTPTTDDKEGDGIVIGKTKIDMEVRTK